MTEGADPPRPAGASGPEEDSIRLRLTPEAHAALAKALDGRPSGSGVRIWVERGLHPHAQMMIDRPSVRDLPIRREGLLLLVDTASAHFLRDAEVRYRAEANPPGFEVVGPFLPTKDVAGTAAGPPVAPSAGSTDPPAAPASVEDRIRQALKSIYDPEIPMNIVDLGLIYGFDRGSPDDLTIRMTMTSPGCPAVEELVREVEKTARDASGIPNVKVEVVWEPPWGPERMSDFARRQFGYA